MSIEQKDSLYKKFNEKFPLSFLPQMTLEQYTDTKRQDSFCYWVENITRELGSIRGGSSAKFGVYEYNTKPDSNSKNLDSDNKYAWDIKKGKDCQEAYKNVLKDIVKIANAAAIGDFEKIDDDSSISLGHAYRWKIAFLYSNKKLFNGFTKDSLVFLANQIVGSKKYNLKSKTSELQKIIIEHKPENVNLWDYGDKQWETWQTEQAKNNPNSWIKYFEELTKEIKAYSKNHSGLVEKLKSANMPEINTFIRNENDISPFAIFEMVNSLEYLNDKDKREEILEVLGDLFNLQEELPPTLPPIFSYSQKNGYLKTLQEEPKFIELSWELFNLSTNLKKNETAIIDVIDKLQSINNVGTCIISLCLFWAMPNKFIPTSVEIRDYIEKTYNIKIQQQMKGVEYIDSLRQLENSRKTKPKIPEVVSKAIKSYKQGDVDMGAVNDNDEIVTECKELLENSYNLILHGAPGTGKTYLAKKIAKEMGCNDTEIGFVQFHPSYDYTDFVEGLRPKKDDGNSEIGFKRTNGVFKEFCRMAILNIEQSNKKPDELQDEEYFETIYNSIFEDIQNKEHLELDVPNRNNKTLVGIKNNRICYGGDSRNESESNIKAMFLYLFKNDIDSSKWTNNDYSKLINSLTNGRVRVLDYTFYHAILSELLKRARSQEYLKQKKKQILQTEKQKKYVFIIDEINRGELSKIFGELFFTVEQSYRGFDEQGKPKGLIQTQYQNLIDNDDPFVNGFYIPDNVYIIGTMNDIDRSVESMDFAFRRRFTFKEVKATDTQISIINSLSISQKIKEKAIAKMNALNKKIWDTETNTGIEGLSSAYHIGGAYFKKLENYKNENKCFEDLWKYNLEGLLREYLRGMEHSETILEDTLHEAYLKAGED